MMTGASFITIEAVSDLREQVKDSVFIASAQRVDNPAQAQQFLLSLLHRYADASHLCWAYQIGPDCRLSDGGEPSGTAGQPILRAIQGQSLDHVAVGVIRYFGGTLLGTGGLARAYGGIAAKTLRAAARREEHPQIRVIIEVGFTQMGKLYHLLDHYAAGDRIETYSESGLRIDCRLSSAVLDRLESALREVTRGDYTLCEANQSCA